ncbi:MAG: hypothetical protein H0U43_01825 [Chthoniobacterales bacterium]|nr:hypothetical protein [Chthoniobacterales bacterium]
MKLWSGAILVACFATTVFAINEDPPAPDEGLPLEVDPPLLIQDRAPDRSLPSESLDIAKLENDLARAERNAGSGERLYKAGIISRLEAEERALKVVRLHAKLAAARVQQAKIDLEELKTKRAAGVVALNDVEAGETALTEATQAAEYAAEERRTAETEAAARNVRRQQKLLALGSGRKADVSRAQQKLTDLQQPAQ